MSLRRLFSSSCLLPLAMAACSGCSESGPTAPPDKGSPLIEVRFPTSATVFDRDSNGLIDLEVAFDDSLSGIDTRTIEVLANHAVKGPAGQGANLFQVWRVVRADTTGFILEETVDNLLPRGPVSLTVAVEDRVGNRMGRTLILDLPPAARHKIIDLQADIKFNTSQVTIGPDGRKAYVTTEEFGGSALSIVDLERLELLSVVRSPIDALAKTVVDEERGLLYLVSLDEPTVAVFDLASETFLAPIQTTDRGIGAVMSPTRNRLFIGLEVVSLGSSGLISVVDPAQGVEERVIDLGVSNAVNPGLLGLGMTELVLTPAEDVLYATTVSAGQGILVVDPVEGLLLGQIDLWPEVPEQLGGARDLQLDQDHLIATSSSQPGMGRVQVIPIADPTAIRVGRVGQFLGPKELAISPDGTDWALTTGDLGAGFIAIQLMDPGTLRVIWEDRLSPTAVNPQGLAFRPDGNVFLVSGSRVDFQPANAPSELTVYLHR